MAKCKGLKHVGLANHQLKLFCFMNVVKIINEL